LLLAGLEDAARPVTRTLIETIDLAIVALADEEFAEKYMSEDEDYDSEYFWKSQVAYGKIYSKIKDTIMLAGLPEDEANNFVNTRKEQKNHLSSAVHVSVESSFRSFATPSLNNRNLLAVSPQGHVSIHSPGHASMVIDEIYKFGALVVRFIISPTPPTIFKNIEKENTDSLLASFLVLQELVTRYESQLPPPFHSLWDAEN
jgi:hypothetical protein